MGSNNPPQSDSEALAQIEQSIGSASVPPVSDPYYKERERHEQDMRNIAQRRDQRERFDNRFYYLLVGQVSFLVVLILLQGFGLFGFYLNQWAFGIFVNGSLIQSYLLVRYIAADLFKDPGKK